MSPFWQNVLRFEKAKILYGMAVRNSLAVGIPMGAGVLLGHPAGGVVAAIGALNVSYSDGTDPYFTRARRMLAASILVALAVFLAMISAGQPALSVGLTAAAGFASGLAVAVSQSSSDIGNITLVTLIAFGAHAQPPLEALQSGAIALAGGLLQTAFALALWPAHRHAPERRILSAFYAELARAASAPAAAAEAPAGSQQSTQAQNELATLSRNPSLEAERYLALLSQGERIRLALVSLARVRHRMSLETAGVAWVPPLARCLELGSRMLASVAQSLLSDQPANPNTEVVAEMRERAESFRSGAPSVTPEVAGLLQEATWQVEALTGQLVSAVELTSHLSTRGAAAFARSEAQQPWHLRLTGAVALLRANLTLQSAAFRHGLRMAACVAVGEAMAHAVGWQRSYWIPMTVAIVLRPDFTGTFSRGLLRVLGTLIGLAIATVLLHALAPSVGVQVAMIAALTFLMRSLGRANYGIFVIALSAMIVQLLTLTGVAPGALIWARGINTFAGGVIALIAYALWPTWEVTLVGENLARLFDTYREYFDVVRDSYLDPDHAHGTQLDRTRLACRLERSNLEASFARLHTEPGVPSARLAALDRILANSHRFIHAVMSLEAGLSRSRPVPARPPFRAFSEAVDQTLESFAAGIRGTPAPAGGVPDLRHRQLELFRSGDPGVERYELVNIETDRITNSLNTLGEELGGWMQDSLR